MHDANANATQARKLAGIPSHGMILAASDASTAEVLRDKLKEVHERLYEANMECPRVENARRPKRARQASSVDDANVRCEVTCHSSGIQVLLLTD